MKGNIWGERSKIQSDSLRPLSREDSPSVEFFFSSFLGRGVCPLSEGDEQSWHKTLSRDLWKHFSCQEYLLLYIALALYFCCERSSGSLFGQSGKRGFSFKSSHKSWSTQLLSISKRVKKTNSKNTFIMQFGLILFLLFDVSSTPENLGCLWVCRKSTVHVKIWFIWIKKDCRLMLP